MQFKINSIDFKIILIAGAIWGMSEVLMGACLNGCAFRYWGAISTGLAFFYFSFTWTSTRKILPLILLLLFVFLFKTIDALILGVPVTHGSVLNPGFAFVLQTMAFLALVLFFSPFFLKNTKTRMLIGGGAALAASLLFPFAGYFTGSAACLVAGTQIPVSVYTSPVAIVISFVTVPLGFYAAGKIRTNDGVAHISKFKLVNRYWPAMLFIICIALTSLNGTI